ncbi:c-type cytochrome biogenesis protein CcmI/CycH [Novosphingobium sp.]|uniref:c-type cytochrome biogenesis protein CcmI/CycH n=1 Tax=Novosphingobium sp. TaxID=1874826 RepID=UPI003D0D7DAA
MHLPSRFAFVLACVASIACNDKLPPPSDSATRPAAPAAVGATPAPADPTQPVQGGTIVGRIEVAPALAQQIKPGQVIFVVARDAESNRPIAAVKLAAPAHFPLNFQIDGSNVMIAGSTLGTQVKLTARADQDGDAMSKTPGDVTGEMAAPIPVPAHDVILTLDRVI